jgi:hypothetical protein
VHRPTSGGVDMVIVPSLSPYESRTIRDFWNSRTPAKDKGFQKIGLSTNLARLARASWCGFVATMFKGKPKEV